MGHFDDSSVNSTYAGHSVFVFEITALGEWSVSERKTFHKKFEDVSNGTCRN